MSSIVRSVVPFIIFIAATAGCAANQDATSGVRHDPNRISAEEIEATAGSTALDIVQKLRPRWLQNRGQDSFRRGPTRALVYMDGARMGGLSYLQRISINNVGEMQYLDGRTATQRFGVDHGGGAILIETR